METPKPSLNELKTSLRRNFSTPSLKISIASLTDLAILDHVKT